ncbi:SulP family inorganic anion transporter [Salinicola rhizosphaerae]|uniref:Membrane protein n=1 Tax=Salinicola rhizosphaerae TaxID=1443141 RepID=A0ABQ3DXF5_9GAMM|nr:SulP family inorganic anion transporter [Salinicola rhizosphaerae]GHB19425.1 membrane protein [Salinicola rhizosphaerae]
MTNYPSQATTAKTSAPPRSSETLSLRYLTRDVPAGIVVFLIAISLCLGVAIASGAPPISGLMAGMVGGLVVTMFSGSALSVSGPTASLTVIVLSAIEQLGGFAGLLTAVMLAGVIQIVMGFLKLGRIGAFLPSSVIKGMMAGIGLILILGQLPMALGHTLENMPKVTDPVALFSDVAPLSVGIAVFSLALLIVWERPMIQRLRGLSLVPGALLAVLASIAIDLVVSGAMPSLALGAAHHLQFGDIAGPGDLAAMMTFPDLGVLTNPAVYSVAFTIAIIASLEMLLSLEAIDKLDPLKRRSPPHRELKAQGIGNMVCGLIGALPVTAVIVRSSANASAGGRTRVASMVHGALLLVSVAFLSMWLEMIPLATLAAILLHTGYKLTKPALFMAQYREGMRRFVPFTVTVVTILATDLLVGVLVGLVCSLYFLLKSGYRSAIACTRRGDHTLLRFQQDVSFLNREEMRQCLDGVPNGGELIIDATGANFIDPDIREDIRGFIANAPKRGIVVELRDVDGTYGTFGHDPQAGHGEARERHSGAVPQAA